MEDMRKVIRSLYKYFELGSGSVKMSKLRPERRMTHSSIFLLVYKLFIINGLRVVHNTFHYFPFILYVGILDIESLYGTLFVSCYFL